MRRRVAWTKSSRICPPAGWRDASATKPGNKHLLKPKAPKNSRQNGQKTVDTGFRVELA